ncbi:MAG TPA: quinoprotein relay system zinc metallohydrolase 2 [Paracoccus sp. (in: a-proteobacteria)]|uniref:quinoprotein relay system zinc metallohydrolase 2 n=1 Tax=Paracoccus sp. TaxID=267 RepID=UPI002C0CD8E4|nr:quinoprotein relay system zinc metallohydrolase 2 [Paracoccus sp. (in: a-proteobacteria)]HWL56017.1 quinoprotein relay system zinc metallohydrolase 2 [Paracoccus sp. (in: a-proteobacteria)]
MFHLLLATCLANDPAICAERLLPAAESASQDECHRKAEPIARDWLARHPELKGGDARCVETPSLPLLGVQEVADGIYVHQGAMEQSSVRNQGRIANLAFVVGDTVAVIDAGGSRAEGEALYAAIRKVTDKPVSHLILTHMHPDHIFGAEVFAEAGASIVANAKLPDAVARRAEAWMFSFPTQIGKTAFLGTRIAPVDQKVDAPMTISLGPTELQLRPQPSAHTDNDLTVFDSASATLFTGDLVFLGLTPSLDGSLANWIGWLEAGPPDPAPALIVPGHGPVTESWDEATLPEANYLRALRDATRKAVSGGMALSQAIPAITAMMKPYSEGWADFTPTTARNAATSFSQLEWE